MATKAYQLTCDCGQSHVVVLRQAGETLLCGCGQSIEIPTLRAMRHLSPMETEADLSARSRPPRSWSRLQGSLFAGGLVVTLLSLVTLVYFCWMRSQLMTEPMKVEDVEFIRDIMQLTPTQSWDAWTQAFRDEELGARNKPFHEINREYSRRFLGMIIVSSIFLLLGLAALIASLLRSAPTADP